VANRIGCHYFILDFKALIFVRYLAAFIILLSALAGCSSSGARAPVTDLTLSKNYRHPLHVKKVPRSKKTSTYKVKAGDTLYAIAWKTGLDVNTLAKRNNLMSPYIIYQGQLLSLSNKDQNRDSNAIPKKVKITSLSQKKAEKTSARNTGQSGDKNSSKKVEHKKTKAYSGKKSKSVVVKSKQKVSDKINHWRWPVQGKLTKTFSSSQVGMQGVSIANRRGTAIYAAASGQVVYAGNGLRGYGNLIIIKHNSDYLSAYAHNDKLLIVENAQIKENQKIAIMGDSGTSSVHLHFEIRYRGKSVDPLRYLPKR